MSRVQPAPAVPWSRRVEAGLQRTWWRSRPTALALALYPLSRLYGGLAALAARLARTKAVPTVPLLVVGNLVVGGAGKTPAVIALVLAFQAAGRRPAVVSRGYGRRDAAVREVQGQDPPALVGDEALLIRRRTGVPVWVGRDRAAAVVALCRAHPDVDVIVSDDGLQHLAMARTAELLVFDDRGIGNGLLMPAGPLRAALPDALGPNQRVLYSGSRVSTTLPGAVGQRRLTMAWPWAAWWRGDASAALPLAQLRSRPVLAAAGLAAPERFFAMLEAAGLMIERLPLPDHFDFAQRPWQAEAADVVVTEKDAVKLAGLQAAGTRVWVLPLDFQLPTGLAAELLSLLPLPP